MKSALNVAHILLVFPPLKVGSPPFLHTAIIFFAVLTLQLRPALPDVPISIAGAIIDRRGTTKQTGRIDQHHHGPEPIHHPIP
ncbi:MAG TPA: hypothetical protein PK760_05250, partial [Flavobacteriales bacterium]|nr:hypothetical protein [Flavobacteriales bacterium]